MRAGTSRPPEPRPPRLPPTAERAGREAAPPPEARLADTMKRSLARPLRVAFGVGLFSALVYTVGPRALVAVLRDVRPAGLALGALAYAALVLVKTARWLRVLRIQDLSIPPREALRAYGLGMLLGAVTPGRRHSAVWRASPSAIGPWGRHPACHSTSSSSCVPPLARLAEPCEET